MRLRALLMIGTLLYSPVAIAQDAEDEPIRPVDVAEKSATRAGKKAATGPAADADLSFNDKAGSGKRESGFLYFKTDTAPAADRADGDENLSEFTPRAGAVEGLSAPDPVTDSLLFTGFTPRHLATSLSFNYGDDGEAEREEGINVTLSSRISTQDTLPGEALGGTYLNGMLPYQAYNLGLNIGYQGFNLGATVRNEESPFLSGIRGYDVGLSYSWSSFSTSLLLGEYSRQRNLLSLADNSSFYALEFGASYRLSRAFRVRGGFRYITFEDEMIANPLLQPNSQLFYLGTNLNF